MDLMKDIYKKEESFTTLTPKKKQVIRIHLLRLIDQDSIGGVESKSLEYYVSIIQLSLLDSNVDSMKYQNKLMRIAQILLTKASVPEIFAKKDIGETIKILGITLITIMIFLLMLFLKTKFALKYNILLLF